MAQTSKTFRIFISSTFSDLKEERNALQKQVFPRLRELCMAHGCRFQAIDLRWGVREEAALDQQTMKICLDEIGRCQKTSPRPNFIVLLGERYGWRPLPAEISVDEFEKIEKRVSDAGEKALLLNWYKRDDNGVPPVYCLQPRVVEVKENATDEEKKKAMEDETGEWVQAEQTLRTILLKAISGIQMPKEQELKYISSATEQEIAAGAMKVGDAKEHVFCFFRKIKNLPEDRSAREFIDLDPEGKPDTDAAGKLEDLKNRLRQQLSQNVAVIGQKPGWSDRKVLDAYYAAIKDRYCVRCGACSSSCSRHVDVPSVHRSLMYWEGYGDLELARVTYRRLSRDENAQACMSCSRPTCRCVNGIKIEERMRYAHTALA